MKAEIRNFSQLNSYLSQRGEPPATPVEGAFPLRIPVFYANLIDWTNPEDPLRRMVIPDEQEARILGYELADPIGDASDEPVPGLVHRYPDRALLLLSTHCGVHCRFCFRREVIGKPRPVDIPGILSYILSHPEISEVIFSGGDPGSYPAPFFTSIIKRLEAIPHVRSIRVHTRLFVVDPTQFQVDWIQSFVGNGQAERTIILHINHPREVTPELEGIVKLMKSKGVVVKSQSVLLKGVNAQAETLSWLFKAISAAGIIPYYLHHLDEAPGTNHFRVSIAEGRRLYSAVYAELGKELVPKYVLDLPGGDGKVPVMSLSHGQGGVYHAINFEERPIAYRDPSEEGQ